jgi:hypothetical protein
VFWTRNPGPFQPVLEAVAAQGSPFVLQLTITGYPRALERRVLAPDRAVALARALRGRWGAAAVVWRYDPILVSDLTPPDWHRATFAGLAQALAGTVDEVVTSFATIYRKTQRNLDQAARAGGFAWRDPALDEKRALLATLAGIAAERGMRLTLCAQPDLIVAGAHAARCIDAERLSRVAGRPVLARAKGNRPGCACPESRDIGAYDSCPHGCAYCYAVSSHDRARAVHDRHDRRAEALDL